MKPRRAICFVIMPFGKKPDASRRVIDFDSVYRTIIEPAIREVGFDPLRADEEMNAGLIHRPMYERLLICDYAIADLTLFNPNVYYELGVRHAGRPQSTVLISAEASPLPFDIANLRTQSYAIDAAGAPADPAAARAALVARLDHCKRHDQPDSPLFELLDGFTPPRIEHTKTDVFRQQVELSREFRVQLDAAKQDVAALDGVRASLGDICASEAGAVISLYLAYREAEAYGAMFALYREMDPVLRNSSLVQEQHAFALNRVGRGMEAEELLKELIEQRGATPERCGLLGRVYKDRWEAAKAADDSGAEIWLGEAIEIYRKGFEADWRDAYPGVNAVTLMAIADPDNPDIAPLATVVRYAVERKLASGEKHYWDYATLVELAVVSGNFVEAERQLKWMLAYFARTGFAWNAKTTAKNFRFIRDARNARGEDVARLEKIIGDLETRGGKMT